jgi:hypothetical protein
MWMIHWSINNTRVDPGADKLMVVSFEAMIPYDTDERRKYLNSGLAYHNNKYREWAVFPVTINPATNKPGHQQARHPEGCVRRVDSEAREGDPRPTVQNEFRVCAGVSRTWLNNWCLMC